MITCRTKTHLGLAALLVWTGLAGVAAASCEDDPLGSSGSGCQDLQLGDPGGGSECDGPLEVTDVSSGGVTLNVGLSNSTSRSESGYLIVTVVMNGELLTFAEPVLVPGGSRVAVQFRFPVTITPINIGVCSKRPGGIVDTPDPVAITVHPSDDEEDDEEDEAE